MVEIRILVGLDSKAKVEDVVEAVKGLLGERVKGNLRKELARLEAALERRGGRGAALEEQIAGLRARIEEEED